MNRRPSTNPTPVTEFGLIKYDFLPAEDAAVRAWNGDGINPRWHALCKERVRAEMPLLARALDRAQPRPAKSAVRPL